MWPHVYSAYSTGLDSIHSPVTLLETYGWDSRSIVTDSWIKYFNRPIKSSKSGVMGKRRGGTVWLLLHDLHVLHGETLAKKRLASLFYLIFWKSNPLPDFCKLDYCLTGGKVLKRGYRRRETDDT